LAFLFNNFPLEKNTNHAEKKIRKKNKKKKQQYKLTMGVCKSECVGKKGATIGQAA